jgi:hypothetical protein
VNASLVTRVEATVNAFEISPADEGMVGLALVLAWGDTAPGHAVAARRLGAGTY